MIPEPVLGKVWAEQDEPGEKVGNETRPSPSSSREAGRHCLVLAPLAHLPEINMLFLPDRAAVKTRYMFRMCSANNCGNSIAQTKDVFSLFLITEHAFYQIKDFSANFHALVYMCQMHC